MRVRSLTVGRGRKIRRGLDEENQTYYEVEVEVEEAEKVEDAKAQAIRLVENWLHQPSDLDQAELEKLPWMSYIRRGEKADENESAWLFVNTRGVEGLVRALKASKKGRLQIKNFEYAFSGNQSQFVRRRRLRSPASMGRVEPQAKS